ncbi:hypothetical protein L6452_40718 [Arctium lappa]|uniref:Uncharacterized protein n=1 Tax=Arctium lappa TaxID=4217 RepID=A0ACB8XNE9_ARCLA|nr:hypothetical protein L6452_40718 [Arctium lappa]
MPVADSPSLDDVPTTEVDTGHSSSSVAAKSSIASAAGTPPLSSLATPPPVNPTTLPHTSFPPGKRGGTRIPVPCQHPIVGTTDLTSLSSGGVCPPQVRHARPVATIPTTAVLTVTTFVPTVTTDVRGDPTTEPSQSDV